MRYLTTKQEDDLNTVYVLRKIVAGAALTDSDQKVTPLLISQLKSLAVLAQELVNTISDLSESLDD